MKNKLKANVSLTTVLIMIAVLLLSGITVIISTIDLAKSNQDAVYHELNVFRARSCVEEALNRIKFDHAFTGTATITYADGNCSAVVTNDAGGNINLKYLAITAQTSNYYYTVNKMADITDTPFIVTNQ